MNHVTHFREHIRRREHPVRVRVYYHALAAHRAGHPNRIDHKPCAGITFALRHLLHPGGNPDVVGRKLCTKHRGRDLIGRIERHADVLAHHETGTHGDATSGHAQRPEREDDSVAVPVCFKAEKLKPLRHGKQDIDLTAALAEAHRQARFAG